MNGLQDKVILVTGAASGLGYADAEFLTESGATVVMTDINEDSGKAVADRLGNLFLGQNVADEHRWSEVMSEIRDRFGRLDGLVNNAGISPIADIDDYRGLETNFSCTSGWNLFWLPDGTRINEGVGRWFDCKHVVDCRVNWNP